MSWRIIEGDCVEQMRAMDETSVDAVVCDPPYGLEFMGKEWDALEVKGRGARAAERRAAERTPDGEGHSSSKGPYLAAGVDWQGVNQSEMQQWHEAWAIEALRVLKPGGHLLAFGGTRTYHRLACAIEDAGFEIRDTISWMYGSGFPKSLSVSKAIDKAAGAEREVVGTYTMPADSTAPGYVASTANEQTYGGFEDGNRNITAPATPEAAEWSGWGTALKPAHEPIVVARKPLAGTVAATVLEHGTGALNVDGCRIGKAEGDRIEYGLEDGAAAGIGYHGLAGRTPYDGTAGRWPANVVLDEEAAAMLDEQTEDTVHGAGTARDASEGTHGGKASELGWGTLGGPAMRFGDSGGASRFFYCAKADRVERGSGNTHPTVKPVELMRWLVRLVTPPEGTVLDPFAGSGTTGIAALCEGFSFVGIEREPDYCELARNRIRDDQPLLNTASEVAA